MKNTFMIMALLISVSANAQRNQKINLSVVKPVVKDLNTNSSGGRYIAVPRLGSAVAECRAGSHPCNSCNNTPTPPSICCCYPGD